MTAIAHVIGMRVPTEHSELVVLRARLEAMERAMAKAKATLQEAAAAGSKGGVPVAVIETVVGSDMHIADAIVWAVVHELMYGCAWTCVG